MHKEDSRIPDETNRELDQMLSLTVHPCMHAYLVMHTISDHSSLMQYILYRTPEQTLQYLQESLTLQTVPLTFQNEPQQNLKIYVWCTQVSTILER